MVRGSQLLVLFQEKLNDGILKTYKREVLISECISEMTSVAATTRQTR